MSSLKDSIAPLESDLKAVPPRISVYHDLPFAIMRYDPTDEWELRREIKLLATRLEAVGKERPQGSPVFTPTACFGGVSHRALPPGEYCVRPF